jgi:hypothetical protein
METERFYQRLRDYSRALARLEGLKLFQDLEAKLKQAQPS